MKNASFMYLTSYVFKSIIFMTLDVGFMAKDIKKTLNKLPKSRQKKIRKRANELVAIELTVQELRRERNLTQEQIAELLGVGQDSVSRLERRGDIKLSTLNSYISALGGELRIIADFPDLESVQINDLLKSK